MVVEKSKGRVWKNSFVSVLSGVLIHDAADSKKKGRKL
jgi:hypothetical protein